MKQNEMFFWFFFFLFIFAFKWKLIVEHILKDVFNKLNSHKNSNLRGS